MERVRPKKALGQHFLTDQGVAREIVASLRSHGPVLEVGPGTGVLTQYLLQQDDIDLKVVEIDSESVRWLLEHYPKLAPALYEADFLKMDLRKLFPASFAVIGNFPYNISSQIFFKVLECRDRVPEVVCMIQKEVAERMAAGPGSKTYGILSVLMQAWYDIEYLFTVGEGAFLPPPKVKSAVIRLTRSGRESLGCDESLFKTVVKTTFNQRRKTIRNSLKPVLSQLPSLPAYIPYLDARPEQLSVEEFVELTKSLSLP
jgi:16S rRNA (adenine1518-N6/adenine1519-N6)-dimethyltransferase